MCLFVARSALSLALQALPIAYVMFFRACSRLHRIIRRCNVKKYNIGFMLLPMCSFIIIKSPCPIVCHKP
uniref:Acetylcholinesterase (Ace) protein n=1 Tax=Pararge aegeria TaxID=116150 RepID=S4PRH7_9NEOP